MRAAARPGIRHNTSRSHFGTWVDDSGGGGTISGGGDTFTDAFLSGAVCTITAVDGSGNATVSMTTGTNSNINLRQFVLTIIGPFGSQVVSSSVTTSTTTTFTSSGIGAVTSILLANNGGIQHGHWS